MQLKQTINLALLLLNISGCKAMELQKYNTRPLNEFMQIVQSIYNDPDLDCQTKLKINANIAIQIIAQYSPEEIQEQIKLERDRKEIEYSNIIINHNNNSFKQRIALHDQRENIKKLTTLIKYKENTIKQKRENLIIINNKLSLMDATAEKKQIQLLKKDKNKTENDIQQLQKEVVSIQENTQKKIAFIKEATASFNEKIEAYKK